MKKISYLLLFVFIVLMAGCLTGAMAQSNDTIRIKHKHYECVYNRTYKVPILVHWCDSISSFVCVNKISRKAYHFTKDFRIKDNTSFSSDYAHSKYDEGHIFSAADNQCDSTGMKECFLYTNCAPQNPDCNRYTWEGLEVACRDWAKTMNLEIWAGVIVEKGYMVIGEDKIAVPSKFWKVIYCKENNEAIGFIMANKNMDHNYKLYVAKISDIEALSGFKFKLPSAAIETAEDKFKLLK